jgi:hypothetical protein
VRAAPGRRKNSATGNTVTIMSPGYRITLVTAQLME